MLEKLAIEEKVLLSRLVGGGSALLAVLVGLLLDVLGDMVCRMEDWGGGKSAVVAGEDMNAEKSSSSSSNSDVGCF